MTVRMKQLAPDYATIVFMVAIHIGALFVLLPSNFSWAAVGLVIFLHWMTGGLGITLGFHRLVTHRSFQTPKWDDPIYRFLGRHFFTLQVALAVVLYLMGGWSFVVWGIFLRLVVVFHCTWLVNSATHKFGYRNYESNDNSTNCWWVALLTYGEGWHNNHHTYQYSARHGLKWWEIDMTWMTIWLLEKLGLATKIKLIEETC